MHVTNLCVLINLVAVTHNFLCISSYELTWESSLLRAMTLPICTLRGKRFMLICSPPGVYGDVVRVKIMFNKKDNALVQFADPSQAQVGTSDVSGTE